MKKKISLNSMFLYLTSFVTPFLIIVVAMYSLKIVPFGENTFLISDASGLYINSLSYIGRMFRGLEGVVYSFEKGLGGNMMGYIGGSYMNPVYIIFCFFDIADYPLAYSLVCLCNLSLCGLTMYILLKDLYGHKVSNLIFSTSYALMGFCSAYCFQIMFFAGVQALPLMIVGIRRIFQKRNSWLYVLAIAYALFSNYYQGYVLCVFSVLVFFSVFLLEKDNLKGSKLAVFVKYLLSSVWGGLLPIITWLPAFLSLKGGRLDQTGIRDFSFAENMPFLEIGSKLFSGANSTNEQMSGYPNIYVGLLPVALVILFFMNKRIDKRKKTIAAGLIGFYLLMFYIIAFNMMMHGGTTTNWFNYRYSYIFSFLLIFIAAFEWQYVMEASSVELKRCFVAMILVTLVIFSKKYSFVIGGLVLFDFAILLIMALVWYMHRKEPISNPLKTVNLVILVLTCFSLFVNFTVSTYNLVNPSGWSQRLPDYQDTVEKVNPLVSGVKLANHDFYRMEVTKQLSGTCGNDPFLYGYNGVGHGGSHERNFVRKELFKLGVHWYDMRNYYEEGIPAATDALLGIKYLIANEDITEEKNYIRLTDMEQMGLGSNGENYDLYQSTYELPIAFMSEITVNDFQLSDEDIFDNLNKVWQGISDSDKLAFISENDIMFESLNMIDTRRMSASDARSILEEYKNDPVIYAGSTFSEAETKSSSSNAGDRGLTVSLIMDEQPQFCASLGFSFTAKQEGPIYVYHRAALMPSGGSGAPILKYMGYYHKGDQVKGYLLVQKDYVDKVTFEEFSGRFRAAYADLDALQSMSDMVREQPTTIEKIKESHLKGTMTAGENQELLFTIPWDEGWTCYVDGQKTELQKVLGVFMAAKVTPGEHAYEMLYEPEGLSMAMKISIADAILTLLYLVIGWKLLDKVLVKKTIEEPLDSSEKDSIPEQNNTETINANEVSKDDSV